MVKFKFLSHLLVDHLADLVAPRLIPLSALICCIHLLCDWSIRLCHRKADICYFVESYLFSLWYDWSLWPAIRRDSVSLLRFPFLIQVKVSWCVIVFSRLKRPCSCFSPLLFPSYCHSIVYRVVSIVSDVLLCVFLCSLQAIVSTHQLCLRSW